MIGMPTKPRGTLNGIRWCEVNKLSKRKIDEIKEIINRLNDNEFKTPLSVNEDEKYYKDLKEKYDKILADFEKINDTKFLNELKMIRGNVLDAIQKYYSGQLTEACELVEAIIKEFAEEKIIIEEVNKHFVFRWIIAGQKVERKKPEKEIDFYKARVAKGIETFKADEMIHIPFRKRELVSTQRFSIAGVPCMYLATSTYCCWKELGMPPDNKFNVSHVTLKSLTLFNMAVNLRFLKRAITMEDIDFNEFSVTKDDFIKNYFKLWLLNFSCAYNVREDGRNFKSEYIISQLIMLALKKNNIDGVIYCSRKIDEDAHNLWANPKNLNVAIISKYNNENDEIGLKDYVNIADSINYNEFKQLNSREISKLCKNSSEQLPNQMNCIKIAGNCYSYLFTDFCHFEEYMKNLEKRKGDTQWHN